MDDPKIAIDPDDIFVGELVTVLNFSAPGREPDYSFRGRAGCVMAVCLPYVVVGWLDREDGERVELDTRHWTFMRITKGYANALATRRGNGGL